MGTSAAEAGAPAGPPKPPPPAARHAQLGPNGMPYGTIGKAKLSRLLLGGNLVSGFMHSRDLNTSRAVPGLCHRGEDPRDPQVAEEHGINTVFETAGSFVDRYNKEFGGHMQFIPSIHPSWARATASSRTISRESRLRGPALYVWGVSADQLCRPAGSS